WINEIGDKYSQMNEIPFLFADFKKKNRYLRSIQISKELGMYRQEYCGCVYSKVEREKYEEAKKLREGQKEGEV
ncbi:MAG: epoxyqueuosine reductase QueH, partial [Fusobacterium sp.]|nr:epoxyqueuosine reductase QueH [Fusobacterium sp.]